MAKCGPDLRPPRLFSFTEVQKTYPNFSFLIISNGFCWSKGFSSTKSLMPHCIFRTRLFLFRYWKRTRVYVTDASAMHWVWHFSFCMVSWFLLLLVIRVFLSFPTRSLSPTFQLAKSGCLRSRKLRTQTGEKRGHWGLGVCFHISPAWTTF